jgi:MFS family permease
MSAEPAPQAQSRAGAAAWAALAVFVVLHMVAYLDRLLLLLLVDPIRKTFGATDIQIGLLQGLAFMVSFSLCGLPLGWAVDRYPRRWIVFLGMNIWSVAAAAAGLAQQFWQLILSRVGVGAGEAALAPAVYSMLADMFPPQRLALPMAIFTMGAVLGQGVSYILGGARDRLGERARVPQLSGRGAPPRLATRLPYGRTARARLELHHLRRA